MTNKVLGMVKKKNTKIWKENVQFTKYQEFVL